MIWAYSLDSDTLQRLFEEKRIISGVERELTKAEKYRLWQVNNELSFYGYGGEFYPNPPREGNEEKARSLIKETLQR